MGVDCRSGCFLFNIIENGIIFGAAGQKKQAYRYMPAVVARVSSPLAGRPALQP